MVHIYNEILPSHTTEQHLVDKNGPRDCHTEWSKSGREKQISCINKYMLKNGIDGPICKAKMET